LSPLLGFLALVLWFVIYKKSGFVSLGSILSAFAVVYITGALGYPPNVLLMVGLVAVLVLVKHKSNIKRLLEGRELRV
ncbi:MAG TPA: glycerol-3-phosphate acyltransferase, partial [Aquificales bacterium]|nr:glycerol-3-phosphate acyltransferase [Aquificales bacterium]